MPSSALLTPSSITFHLALSSAPTKSPSLGPSRIICCSVIWPCEKTGFLTPDRRLDAGAASLLARPRNRVAWGRSSDCRAARGLRVGEALRCCCCSRRCCESTEPCAAALAPRVCADCSRRRARCVRGDGGGCRSVWTRGWFAADGTSRDGECMVNVLEGCRGVGRVREECGWRRLCYAVMH